MSNYYRERFMNAKKSANELEARKIPECEKAQKTFEKICKRIVDARPTSEQLLSRRVVRVTSVSEKTMHLTFTPEYLVWGRRYLEQMNLILGEMHPGYRIELDG